MEIGPQPHGVVRSVIFSAMQEGVQLMLDWICQFNSGRFSATNPCRYLFAVCVSWLVCASLCPGTLFEGGWVDVYTMVKNIDYPRDPETHEITAAVHPDLQVQKDDDRKHCSSLRVNSLPLSISLRQDRDFCLLHPGDPTFLSFSGETLRYKGKEALYPFFINEGAYYEKGVALSLARKRRVEIPSVCSETLR